ncbi:hypothetical protein [Candidatus Macondimonas diazotrophica]|nr:hypothetical protein [Candidatus Macondimonas diazotrophica]
MFLDSRSRRMAALHIEIEKKDRTTLKTEIQKAAMAMLIERDSILLLR